MGHDKYFCVVLQTTLAHFGTKRWRFSLHVWTLSEVYPDSCLVLCGRERRLIGSWWTTVNATVISSHCSAGRLSRHFLLGQHSRVLAVFPRIHYSLGRRYTSYTCCVRTVIAVFVTGLTRCRSSNSAIHLVLGASCRAHRVCIPCSMHCPCYCFLNLIARLSIAFLYVHVHVYN